MSNYICNYCNYHTTHKGNYQKHFQTKRHKNNLLNFSQNAAIGEIILEKKHECKYCDKQFKHQSSLSKHIKYSCKQNKDEDLKELARLLNETIKDKDKELKKMQKQIDKLTNKLQIHNVNNITQYNLTNVNNVYLLDYNKTDYSHLTERDYISCITDCNYCIKTLIEKVHFNSENLKYEYLYIINKRKLCDGIQR